MVKTRPLKSPIKYVKASPLNCQVACSSTSVSVTQAVIPDFLKRLAESIESNKRLLSTLLQQHHSQPSGVANDFSSTQAEVSQQAHEQTRSDLGVDVGHLTEREKCRAKCQNTPCTNLHQKSNLSVSPLIASTGVKAKVTKQTEQFDKSKKTPSSQQSHQALRKKSPRQSLSKAPTDQETYKLNRVSEQSLEPTQTGERKTCPDDSQEIICPEYVRQLESLPKFAKTVRSPKQVYNLLADVNLKHLPPNSAQLFVWYKRIQDDVYVKEAVRSFHKSIGMAYFCLESGAVLRFPRISSEKQERRQNCFRDYPI